MSDILHFPSHRPASRRDFDISELVHEVCESFEKDSLQCGIHLDVDSPPNTILNANREQLEIALRALVADAISVSPKTGDVVVTTFENDGLVEIEVADSAAGVFADGRAGQSHDSPAADAMPASLEQVRQIVAAHGGHCSVEVCPDGGRAVTLHLPQDGQSSRHRVAA